MYSSRFACGIPHAEREVYSGFRNRAIGQAGDIVSRLPTFRSSIVFSHLDFVMIPFLSFRAVIIVLVALCLVVMFAGPTFAGESTVCFGATFLQEIAGNRSKIIQLSIVFVLVGIALLFKK